MDDVFPKSPVSQPAVCDREKPVESAPVHNNSIRSFWSMPVDSILAQLKTTESGLSNHAAQEAAKHLVGLTRQKASTWRLLIDQFNSPIIILLFASAIMSLFLNDQTNAVIILFILVASGLLGFWQEWSAADAVERLLAVIETKTTVLRDGQPCKMTVDQVVPGDIVLLSAGDVIPGDGRLFESRHLYVNEAALTGESFPAEKTTDVLPVGQPLSKRTNSVFLGTHVISGTGKAVIVATGASTEFGQVSARLQGTAPESGFERGLRNFGNLLIKVAIGITTVVFAVKVATHAPFSESLLLALSLAVGMTPQLLPAITAVVMGAGAKSMARVKVIVKQLIAIENFGSMTVLCSDKTGTLTDGTVQLHQTHNLDGEPSDDVFRFAYINAHFQAGFANPIDHALCSARSVDLSGVTRLDEVPYDFGRKRLSVLVDDNQRRILITKGAMSNVLERCTQVQTPTGQIEAIESHRKQIDDHFQSLGNEGFRVLGLAYREFQGNTAGLDDECNLTFLGTVIFYDPPKPGIVETLAQLRELGIGLKMITGDNHIVAAAVGRQVGLEHSEVMTGSELRQLSGDALSARMGQVDVFAEIEPNQKEQIILALKQTGQVVGYMGDGINDASALHAADVGISVATAVDVAKEAAQVVLLEHDLSVLIRGVKEGRRTFANTLKYVFFVIAGNFGYMFSLAVASICMRSILVNLGIKPFDDPLLPGQILLVNLLADFPAMALASDNVDPELIERPRNWDVRVLAKFMIVFGLSSSLFDFITFGVSVLVFRADEVTFHSLWFVQSVLTGLLIMFIIRTRRSFFSSWPGRLFTLTSLAIAVITLALPYAPFHAALGFTPLSPGQLGAIAVICVMYTLGIEAVKTVFYRFNP